ncbi:MAG: hypothetical protein AAFX99_16140 [Myxococcota bacterium]
MTEFGYLLDKIEAASFETEPFKHITIHDFLKDEHFEAVVRSPQINTTQSANASALIDTLLAQGYTIISFPGCVTSKAEYLDWLEGRSQRSVHAATEGFGLVFRLKPPEGTILAELDTLFRSERLQKVLMAKFRLTAPVAMDAGLQKYLHGYEISPHPDVRSKALTWMLNINPGSNSEALDFHTHYLRFRPEWSYISEFWKHNNDVERCWVPWEWCTTVKQQQRNNSIVFFSPNHDTLHAVKADYNHLVSQRTQLYGNLWYKEAPILLKREFDSLAIKDKRSAHAGWSGLLRESAVGRRLLGVARRVIGATPLR